MKVVLLGLSITSSWGNGHATNYRALVTELAARGHEVLFCERDVPWYANARDLPRPPAGELCLYDSLTELWRRAGARIEAADLVVVGSYVPDGVAVAEGVLARARGVSAFYDIDTPVTVEKLEAGDEEYLARRLVAGFDLYLSFTAGPTLDRLHDRFGAKRPRAFHCFVDPARYRPSPGVPSRWELGYLGTYSEDRQPAVEELLLGPARARPGSRFAVAGPQYPDSVPWPENVERIEHLAPDDHPAFYCGQRFTLNVTRAAMRAAGFSPSVRLFEAAACGTPIVSDRWLGLEEVFSPGREILVVDGARDVVEILADFDEAERARLAARARERVLAEHTARRRVEFLEREVAAIAAGSEVAA